MATLFPAGPYLGVDRNPRYVRYAQRRFGSERTRFICADVTRLDPGEIGEVDVIVAMGLLHHLSDGEVRDLLGAVTRVLSPIGSLLTIDGVSVSDAEPSARWLMARDRGDFIRTPDEYRALVSDRFADLSLDVHRDLLHVPLTGAAYPLLSILASSVVGASPIEATSDRVADMRVAALA